MTDDRDLERYLKGESKFSRRYRDASRQTPPRELDEAILAHARAEARKKGGARRWLTPVALAASMVLGVNLAWNVFRQAPLPEAAKTAAPAPVAAQRREADQLQTAKAEAETQAQEERRADTAGAKDLGARQGAGASERMLAERPVERQAYAAKAAPAPKPEAQAGAGPRVAAERAETAPAAAVMNAPAAPLTEPQKIQRLVEYVERLPGAVFIRNGTEYKGPEAADHMRMKLKNAGDRVKTAEDFIRLCASGSSMSGKPYRIRFADGTERDSGDVLREQLRTMEEVK